jgi:hypothetical protein
MTATHNAAVAWHAFYHWVRLYYQASERFIADRRTKEPAVWNNLYRVYSVLNDLEKAEGRGKCEERLSEKDLKKQLKAEMPEQPTTADHQST